MNWPSLRLYNLVDLIHCRPMPFQTHRCWALMS